jgi:hypothetical protein
MQKRILFEIFKHNTTESMKAVIEDSVRLRDMPKRILLSQGTLTVLCSGIYMLDSPSHLAVMKRVNYGYPSLKARGA